MHGDEEIARSSLSLFLLPYYFFRSLDLSFIWSFEKIKKRASLDTRLPFTFDYTGFLVESTHPVPFHQTGIPNVVSKYINPTGATFGR